MTGYNKLVFLLLCLSEIPLNAQQMDSVFLLDTTVTYSCASGDQVNAAAAFDGTNYLVVWQDARYSLTTGYDIWGARFSPAGVIIDTGGFVISRVANDQVGPKVSFDGTNYLVVWQDNRSGPSHIYGTRVGQDGIVIDTAGFVISGGTLGEYNPDIAFGDTNFFVVWQDNNVNPFSVYAARVTADGNVLDSAGIRIAEGAVPACSFGDTNFLAVWQYNNNNIFGCRVNQSGVILDSTDIVVVIDSIHSNQQPSLAFDGTNYLVVWNRYGSWILGKRISAAGNIVDSLPIEFYHGAFCSHPSVYFGDTSYLVVYHNVFSVPPYTYQDRISGRCVRIDGTASPEVVIRNLNSQTSPSLAFDGLNYMCVWHNNENGFVGIGGNDIWAAGISQDCQQIIGSHITITGHYQIRPDVSFDGHNYFTVWEDARNMPVRIFGNFINPTGNIVYSSGFIIYGGSYPNMYPAVTFGKGKYLVAWKYYYPQFHGPVTYNISGSSVTPAGSVSSRYLLGHWPQVFHDLSYCNSRYILVSNSSDIIGDIIDTNFNILNTVIISNASENQSYAKLTGNGNNYLAVWQDGRSGTSYDIYGCRLDSLGVPVDSQGILINAAVNDQLNPEIACNNMDYFAVWQDLRGGSSYDIYAARVAANGIVLDTLGVCVCAAPGNQIDPAVCFDGVNYIVVWSDYRNGDNYDIYGAKISPAGVILDTFLISDQPGDQFIPAICAGDSHQVFIAYAGWTDSIGHRPVKDWRVWGVLETYTGIEEVQVVEVTPCFEVSPNPFRGMLSIRTEGLWNNPIIKIYDIAGRLVISPIVKEMNELSKIEVDNLPEGVYFIHIQDPGHTQIKKVIHLK